MDKMVLIIVGFVQLLVAVNSLKCYECIDCPTVTDILLKECGSELVTIPPSPITPIPSTVPHNSTTISPNTTTQSVNSTTTTPSATASPNSTTTTSITTASANSTSPSTTVPPNSISTLSSTTVESTNSTTTLTPTPSTNRTAQLLIGQNISREKRDVSFLSVKNDFVELPEYRKRATVSYYCYKATVKHNNTYDIVIRGCAQKYNKTWTLCDKVPEDIEVKKCATCESDKCNGAYITQLPFLLMFITLSIAVTF